MSEGTDTKVQPTPADIQAEAIRKGVSSGTRKDAGQTETPPGAAPVGEAARTGKEAEADAVGATEKTKEADPAAKRAAVLTKLQDEAVADVRREKEQAGGTLDETEETNIRTAVEKAVVVIETEDDPKKVLMAMAKANADMNDLKELLPDGDPKLLAIQKEVDNEEREIIGKTIYESLPNEVKEKVDKKEFLDTLEKIQNSDGTMTDAEIIDAVAQFNLDRNANEIILSRLGRIKDQRLKDLLDRIDEKKQVETELDREGESEATPTPESEEAEEQLKAAERALDDLAHGGEGSADRFSMLRKDIEKVLKNINKLTPGQIWAALGILVLIGILAGSFGAMSVLGQKKR